MFASVAKLGVVRPTNVHNNSVSQIENEFMVNCEVCSKLPIGTYIGQRVTMLCAILHQHHSALYYGPVDNPPKGDHKLPFRDDILN